MNIPKEWIVKKLGDFAEYTKGKKPIRQQKIFSEIFKYPYVDIKAFEQGIIDSYTDGEKCTLMENLYAYYFLQSKYLEINKRAKGSGTPHVDLHLLWS